jgi:hypothetical protein
MYGTIDRNKLEYPGHFTIGKIFLTSYRTQFLDVPQKIDITNLVGEINIYEGIKNKVLTGNLILLDAQAVPTHLPLSGFERLEFKVFTPGCSRGYDFTAKSGHPMYIYNITNRSEQTARSQAYKLNFCSKEMISNEQTRISQAYKGVTEKGVFDIVRTHLKSKKALFLEETKSNHQYVIPRLRPFKAIDMLKEESHSKLHNTPGMTFYEDADGFHFRSYENMLAMTRDKARPVVAKFAVKPANVGEKKDVIEQMKQVYGFSIDKQFDTLQNYRTGMYASRVVTHNMFNKTFSELDFNYQNEYELSHHTEHDGEGGKQDNKSLAPRLNFGNDKYVSDYPEGVLHFLSTTEKMFNEYEPAPQELLLPRKLSYHMAFETQILSLDVPGFTGLSVGDMVAFDAPSYEPANDTNPLDRDPFMSGRYLVKSVRHRFDFAEKKHFTKMECIKDSYMNPLPQEIVDTFTTQEYDDSKANIKQYDLDDSIVGVATSNQESKFK